MGDSAAGKTSVINKFLYNTFEEKPEKKIQVQGRKVTANGQEVELGLRDMDSDEHRFGTLTCSQYRGINGLIVLFDITNDATFTSVQEGWVSDIYHYGANSAPVFIVGNKLDLAEKRTVSKSEGEALAERNHFRYMEVSAKTGEGIEELFQQLSERILNQFCAHTEELRKSSFSIQPQSTLDKRKKKCSLF